MSDFRTVKEAVQRQFNLMKSSTLFRVQCEKDFLWQLYLDSFPSGTNQIFRKRNEHDCSACRSFIKNAGSMVTIKNGALVTLWDTKVDPEYQPSFDALADFVRACAIENLFYYTEPAIGTDKNYEKPTNGGPVLTWEHYHITLPKELVITGAQMGPKLGEYRAFHDVMLSSLREITVDSIDTVLDLIAQGSLYRGEEKRELVSSFLNIKREFDKIDTPQKQDLFAWEQVKGPNSRLCKVKNDVIGTLLVDLSEGKNLEGAVKSFEAKVAPSNYKRPTSLITPKMRDAAKQTMIDLGLMDSLDRRYAKLVDISVNNVLFADHDAKTVMTGDVFDEVVTAPTNPRNLDKVEEISIQDFITNVLPRTKSLEVLVENRHSGNLVSLIAPVNLTAKNLFKWDNLFSWSFNGDVADSEIRRAVQGAGGRVDGAFRFSHSWNYQKRNASLMDLHVFMPGSTIKPGNGTNNDYGNNERVGWNNRKHLKSGGVQDVDHTEAAAVGFVPVENITFPDIKKMPEGTYICKVHNWKYRGPTEGGFKAEIEFGGELFQYEVTYPLKDREWVQVAEVLLKNGVFSINHSLPTTTASQTKWSVKTQEFHRVTSMMLSPNFWDGKEIGNKIYMFMLDGCKNDGTARGFYNEFLRSEFEPHRKTMEMVGSRMRTEESDDQLSGLGFSSTQRNSIVVRVKGSFTRTLKINF